MTRKEDISIAGSRPSWKGKRPYFKGKKGEQFLGTMERFADYYGYDLESIKGRREIKFYVKERYVSTIKEMVYYNESGSWEQFQVEFREQFPQAFRRSYVAKL